MEFWEMGTVGCDGFVTPDIDDSRKIIFLDSDEEIPFQVEDNYKGEVIEIGKFRFSKDSFGRVKEKLKQIHLTTKHLVIIDEIGPLEMNGKGFEPELSAVIEKFKSEVTSKQLILVVRNTLLNPLIEKYNLQNANVLSLHKFTDLFLGE